MKTATKIILYLLITTAILLLSFIILRPKDDETLVIASDFYREEQHDLDVLFLGSSRNVMNINPAIIYEQQGIKSFAFGGMGQPISTTYHYLVEALRQQSPKVVVLEVGMLSFEEEYPDYTFIVKNTLGIRSLQNRYENILTTAPPDMHTDLMLGFPIYHNRFTELGVADITLGLLDEYKTYVSYKGFMPSISVVSYDEPIDDTADEEYSIAQKNLDYLSKIIELCEKEGIELLFLATPDVITTTTNWSEMNDSIAAAIGEIAVEEGINFLYCDAVAQDIGIDYASDFRDERHLNIWGSAKLSEYIGDYLRQNYDLPSSNDDTQWDEFATSTREILGY